MSRRIRVLLVEDNPADVYFVKAGLRQSELDVDFQHVDDGAAARTLAGELGSPEHPCPDIMLLDLNLPGADGIDVLRQLRSNPRCTDLPVMIVTSSDADQDRKRAAEHNVNCYFRKPADLDEFLKVGEVVKGLLKHRSDRL